MQRLIIEDDEGRATVVPLIRDELTIGRMEGNAIRLTERNVSRKHARLVKQAGGIVIEDLGSYTGVRVNGRRIEQPAPVREGDEIRIGDYRLGIRVEHAAEVPPGGAAPGALGPEEPEEDPTQTQRVPLHAALAGTPGSAAVGGGASASAAIAQPYLDAAPTLPIQTFVEASHVAPLPPPTPAGAPARLVVVTSNLAGTEFLLDRPSLVLGRTPENDLVVNHPSISRHHAKVVRDGDRYTVVDLQSANGVRVAGEPYERVDVQPGDVLELGHVRLRLVGPHESWTFDPREFAPRASGAWKIAAALAGVAVAVVAVLLLQSRRTETASQAPVVAPTLPPKAVEPTPTEMLGRATRAAQAEDWDSAVTTLDLLLGRPAGDPAAAAIRSQVAELKRKVDSERRAKELLASFEQAVAAREPDVAMSRYDEIPSDSLYKSRAQSQLDGVKALFLSAHLELADAARSQGHCEDARAEVEKIQQLEPQNRHALEILRGCRVRSGARSTAAVTTAPAAEPAVAVVAAPPARAQKAAASGGGATLAAAPARPPASRASTSTAASSAAEGADSDATDLIRQAREAWSRQQCGSAIELSRRALKLRPGSIEAHQIMAVCSCSSRDREGALKSYVRLDERSREMVRTLCGRYGLELGE